MAQLTDFDLATQQAKQQQALAQSLREQANQPLQGQMVSGRYVNPSWTQGLAKLLQSQVASSIENQSFNDIKQAKQDLETRNQGDMTDFFKALRGTPVSSTQAVQPDEYGTMTEQTIQSPAQAPDSNAALAMALKSQNPMLQNIGAMLAKEQFAPTLHPVGKSLINNQGKVIGTDEAGINEAIRKQQEELAAKNELARQAAIDKAELAKQNMADRKDLYTQRAQDAKDLKMMIAAQNAEKLKAIPASINTAIIGNSQALKQVDRTLSLLEGKNVDGMLGDKEGTGWKGYMPNAVLNRIDPKGTDVRAMVSDIDSLKIHERSGSAVTASESPRLMPFIPLPTDDMETARKKLQKFKVELASESNAMNEVYSKDQGYRPSPILGNANNLGAPAQSKEITDAINWANQNPNDTRAKAIKQRFGQ